MFDYSSSATFYHKGSYSNILFETYSDARLAALFLENMDEFPVGLFQQFLELVLDPRFKSSEVTFKNTWGIFDRVSTCRRSMALNRTLAKSLKVEKTSGVVPPVVLSLVVDTIVQHRTSFDNVADIDHWRNVANWESYRSTLCNMCLVHRSWTDIAQKGLRRRVVIPYKHINRFLLGPLCGPWITEMLIYWKLEDYDSVRSNDLDLLAALLARTPNVRSLAFNTGRIRYYRDVKRDLKIDVCLDTISNALPQLRDLWLRHFDHESPDESQGSLTLCEDLDSLCTCLPKMHSLESLCVYGWTGSGTNLDWNKHPPSSLKTVDLHLQCGMSEQLLAWLLRPRDNFAPRSLIIWDGDKFADGSYQDLLFSLRSSFHRLEHLAIDMRAGHRNEEPVSDEILLDCNELTSVELFYDGLWPYTVPWFPQSLTFLTIHCPEKGVIKEHASGLSFIRSLKKALSTVPRLKLLFFITYNAWQSVIIWRHFYYGQDPRFYCQSDGASALADEVLPGDLVKFCKDRNIRLACDSLS